MKKSIVVFVLLFSIIAVSGCNVQRRPGPVEPAPAPTQPAQPAQDTQKAQMLAQKISDLEEINSATVVLANNSAWVGVDLKAGSTAALTNQTKDKVTEIVKNEDKSIQNVFVTADADTVTRLRNIAQEIANGRPISGFITELNEIGRRITPSAR